MRIMIKIVWFLVLSFKMLRRGRVAKKEISAEGAFGEAARKGPRSTNRYVETPSAEAFLNFTAKEVICRGKAVCCAIKVEREQKEYCAYVTSLQGAIVFYNISPRTFAERQIELECSGRPGKPKPEQVWKRYKILEFEGFGIVDGLV